MQRSIANVQIRYREIITLYTVRSVCRIMLTITFPFYIYIYNFFSLNIQPQGIETERSVGTKTTCSCNSRGFTAIS